MTTLTALERRYIKRRRAGKLLSPVRLTPDARHPLGVPVKASTRYRVPGKLWALGYHTGVDFACPPGSLAVATQRGEVIWVGTYGGWSAQPRPGKPWAYGLHVIVRTADGLHDYAHCHLSSANVRVGQLVRPGTILGLTGNSGNTTGSHDHVEARTAGGRYGDDVSPRLIRRKAR